MDIYCLCVILVRLGLVLLPIIVSALAVTVFRNKKILAVCLILLFVNSYFLFVHNQRQVSPIYKQEMTQAEIENLYDSFYELTQWHNGRTQSFASDKNFVGDFNIKADSKTKLENDCGDFEYSIDKYVTLNRDYQLIGMPVDYQGKIQIYSKKDNMLLTINYKIVPKEFGSDSMVSLNEITSAGVMDNVSLDGAVYLYLE